MKDKNKIETLELTLQKSQIREGFLRNIILKFHNELLALGLQNHSDAVQESMCLYASDWQTSVDQYIEAAKRQGKVE